MDFNGLFDYVTLMDVLEYAKSFIHVPQPYHHVVHEAGALLGPGGRDRLNLFDEKRTFVGLIRNGRYGFFANSFLVIATKEGSLATDIYKI